MTFLNPFVLFGLLAASLPVLFHLFAQRKARRVEFTSLRFLHKLEKSAMRTVKVKQLLLLIIRTLLVIAIVLAFARPALRGYLGSFFGSSHANTTLVFLLDNSASMSSSDDRGEIFKRAQESAKSIANLLADGDDAIVIPLASIERGKDYAAIHGRKDAIATIEAVKLVDRPADLDDGLHVAARALASSRNVNKEVYVITDDQARNITNGSLESDSARGRAAQVKNDTSATLKLFDATTRLFHLAVGGEAKQRLNLAIDSMKPTTTIYEPGRPVEFEAWVRNTSDVPAQNPVISLFYNDERVAQRSIALVSPNSTEHITLSGPTRGSGIIAVRAELEPDALPFDNKRFTVIEVPAARHIALFVQNPNDAIFVKLALEQSLAEGGTTPFTTEVHHVEELRSLASVESHLDGIMVGIGATGLEQPDAISLKEYLTSGRGAAMFLMPGIDPKVYNANVAPVVGLPTIISKNGTPNDNTHYASFAAIDLSHPFFPGMFDEKTTGASALRGIESPKFYEYYQLNVPKSWELIGLSGGAAFLSEVHVGKGSALIFNAPPTLQFSDLPRKSIFLPLIRRTAAYISAVRTHADENLQPSYVTTEPFDILLPQLRGVQSGSTLLVKGPEGASSRATVSLDAEGKPRIHLESAPVAGDYQVYLDAEARDAVAAFAVNIQSDESDLRRASKAEMRDFLNARMTSKSSVIDLDENGKSLAERILASRYGVELWQSFLVAALVLALLEMLIAREPRLHRAPA